MANKEQVDIVVNQITGLISKILSKSVSDYVRNKDLGQALDFSLAETEFTKVHSLLKKIEPIPFEKLPYMKLSEFYGKLNSVQNNLDNIIQFNPNSNQPAVNRTNSLNAFLNSSDSFFLSGTELLALNLALSEKDSKEVKFDSLLEELNSTQSEIIKQGNDANDQIKGLLDAAKNATAGVGTSKYSEIFQNEATTLSKKADNWLIGSFVLLALIIGLGILYINCFTIDKDGTPAYVIQYSITKILIFTSLFYALAICSRNYKALKHNSIINKHRQNALNTFETFVKAANDDEQTKNAILLEVTRTIFSSQQTGYLSNEGENEPSNKIIEIIKNVSSSKGQ